MKPEHLEMAADSMSTESGGQTQSEFDDTTYRLRFDGQEYAPVDSKTIVLLIERGVLLGHEEIAVLDGPWMTVRRHPALAQIRAMMARELHRFLAELGTAHHPQVASGPSPHPPAALTQTRLGLGVVIEAAIVFAVILSLIVLFAIFGLIISRAFF